MVCTRVLAGEHRMVVDRFIEDAAGVLSEGLGIVERNELEVNLRFYVETQLVPGLLAVNALLLEASSEALERDLPEWIERASTVLPAEAAFLTAAGRGVDSLSYSLLAENLGLSSSQCLGVEVFRDHLLSMAPLVAKVRPRWSAWVAIYLSRCSGSGGGDTDPGMQPRLSRAPGRS